MRSATVMPDLAALVLNSRIGKGSYGDVYHGVVVRGRSCAVAVAAKVMPLEAADAAAVQQEASLQRAASQHPSIVKLLGCFHHDNACWLLLELCSASVQDILMERDAPFEEPQIAAVLAGALSGLHWLHERCRIVHRDIKSGNLLISADGEVKIADFGVAARLAVPASRCDQTRA